MPGKRKRLSNASPMPAYYTNTGGYILPAVEIRGKAPQWAKEQNYYDQLANFYADRFDVNGNNSRLPEIIGRAKANPEFWNEDGSLNQKGNAYITQQKHFGVGSNYYNKMNEYAKQTAYGLAQVAGAPYLAGLTGRQLLGSTIGGTIGSIEGSEIGKRFDNPATGNYAGSELGALLGGLAGGAIGGNVKPLFRKYIKGMTKLDQTQTRYWDKKELKQLLNNKQQPNNVDVNKIYSIETTRQINPNINTYFRPDATLRRNGSTIYPFEQPMNPVKNYYDRQTLQNELIDDWTNWNDYETGNLSDAIFHRKYGGRSKFPFGGGIPDGVPFIENPITYNPNGIDISTNSIVRSRRVPLHKFTIGNTPISQTVKNRQYVPIDEDVINSWNINKNRMAFNDINNNRIRPYSGTRRANNKSNYKYSRNEQSWLNPKNSKVAEQYNRNIKAAKYLKGAGASLPFVALALNQTPDMLYYNDEGYQIDPETNQILDTPVNRRLYIQREQQRRINKAAYPKLEQAANRFININPKNTTNKQSNKNTATNNQSNNTTTGYKSKQNVIPTQSLQTTKSTQTSQPIKNNSINKPVQQKNTVNNKPANKPIQASTNTSANGTYTVKAGNSPWQIAKDNGMTLNTFYKLNPSAKKGIYPGDVVNVNKPANIHKVKSGDSPWQIAKDNNISLDELYRLNPEARNMIYPGNELILPEKTRNKKRYGGSLRRRLESDGYLSY